MAAGALVLMGSGGAPLHAGHEEASGASRGLLGVAVVVDFGVHASVTPRVVVKCLKVARGTNGSAVLAELVAEVHLAAPTYAPSGLLCSIGGEPASGCGTAVAHGYAYWSYWHGGSHWSYADVGPAAWAVGSGDVEGWRFERAGHANATDPPPSAPAGYTADCAGATAGSVRGPSGSSGASTSDLVLLAAVGCLVVVLAVTGSVRWRKQAR